MAEQKNDHLVTILKKTGSGRKAFLVATSMEPGKYKMMIDAACILAYYPRTNPLSLEAPP
jgi:hypothetical protein